MLRHFQWVDGQADMWRVLENQGAFLSVTRALACLATDGQPTRVLGINTRGLLLAGAVANEVGAGVHALLSGDDLVSGPTLTTTSSLDDRDRTLDFRMRSTMGPGDRIVLVDDWIERGNRARVARALVERTGAAWLGTVVVVDDTDAETREDVSPFRSLVRSSELGSDTE